MKKFALYAVLMLFATTHVQAAPSPLPDPVNKYLVKLEQDCLSKSYRGWLPKTDPSVVQQVDVNGDGITDYIINDSLVECEMGAAFRHGNGGTGVTVFAGTSKGAVLAYEDTVFDIRAEGGRAWVMVGGHLCGQHEFKSRAEAISCERELLWDPKSQKLEMAPLLKKK